MLIVISGQQFFPDKLQGIVHLLLLYKLHHLVADGPYGQHLRLKILRQSLVRGRVDEGQQFAEKSVNPALRFRDSASVLVDARGVAQHGMEQQCLLPSADIAETFNELAGPVRSQRHAVDQAVESRVERTHGPHGREGQCGDHDQQRGKAAQKFRSKC